jgi:hypothetical protein
LFGRENRTRLKAQKRSRAKAITFCTGLTLTSIIGEFPTLATASCRLSSEVSSNKFRLIERKELIDAGDTVRGGKVELVCFEY